MADIEGTYLCRLARAGAWVALLAMAGCPAAYRYSTTEHHALGLDGTQLEQLGVALITPATVTGQEEDKQAVAFVFGETMKKERPAIRLVSLPETLSAINAAGLADQYRMAYQEYRDSGVLRREALARIGEVTHTRYIVALKLSGFGQSTENRFGAFGLRLVDTKRANVRLLFQIWDAQTGAIVWEGLQETSTSADVVTEKVISFRDAIGESCTALIKELPAGAAQPSAEARPDEGQPPN